MTRRLGFSFHSTTGFIDSEDDVYFINPLVRAAISLNFLNKSKGQIPKTDFLKSGLMKQKIPRAFLLTYVSTYTTHPFTSTTWLSFRTDNSLLP